MIFARLLCKIALGMAYHTFGDNVFEPIIRSFIRLGDHHPNHYVGGFCGRSGAPIMFDQGHHSRLWQNSGYLLATIQLFASAGSPVSYVVVGPLRNTPADLPVLDIGEPIDTGTPKSEAVSPDGRTTISWSRVLPGDP